MRSHFFYNEDYNIGVVPINKNASTSIIDYITYHNFYEIPPTSLPNLSAKFFYVLSNPIDRFVRGLTQTYLQGSGGRFPVLQLDAISHGLAQISNSELEKFMYVFLRRIPTHSSNIIQPEYKIPQAQMGFMEDNHTMLQSRYIKPLLESNIETVPISINAVEKFPLIIWNHDLLLNKSKDYTHINRHIIRMQNCVKKVLLENKNNGQLDRIWAWLQADIDLWNANISSKYMIDYHKDDKIDT